MGMNISQLCQKSKKNPYPKIWTMEKSGLEPPTFLMPFKRSSQMSYFPD